MYSVCSLSINQARCSHFGFRSTFRGLKVTIIKNSLLYSLYQFVSKFKFPDNKLAENIAKTLTAASGYILIYPLQNVKARMGADLQQERYYSNLRDCIKKIKKHEGTKGFYKGFSAGALQVTAQYLLIQKLIEQRVNYQQRLSNSLLFISLFATSFLAYDFLLYPLDTIKKALQVNGSLGHENDNKRLRDVFKNFTVANYYRGLPIRIMNSSAYIFLSMMMGEIGGQH